MRHAALVLVAATAPAGCAASERRSPASVADAAPAVDRDPYPSTYHAPVADRLAMVGATVLTATGEEIANGTVLREDRSEGRSEGEERGGTWRSRGSPDT